MKVHKQVGISAFAVAIALLAGACTPSSGAGAPKKGTVAVVAAENEYGDVVSQVGGAYVTVSSIESNPNTDPHSYEVSPGVASEIASAQLLVQNGVGYDVYMTRIESASPSSSRRVVIVQQLLGLPDSTPNPHLWYKPTTMPAVADAVAADLSAIQPTHAAYFKANAAKFIASLEPWLDAIASFKAKYEGTPAATTEPVADYLLSAMGVDNLTPSGFQADIMNGVDPTPQDIALENGLFTEHRVRLFCYNPQVTSALTLSVRQTAQGAGVPIVGVYETMPAGYDFQSWMMAEVAAIQSAVTSGKSTEHL